MCGRPPTAASGCTGTGLDPPGVRGHASRMRANEFQDADRDLAEDALRELVAEIAADDYRAKIGSPLTNNTAYLKAVALLQTRDAMQRGGRRRR